MPTWRTDQRLVGGGSGSVFARSLLLGPLPSAHRDHAWSVASGGLFFLSRLRVNKQHIMLMLVMLPMWMNFLLRTYAGWAC